jgi:hypothetical protein
MRSMLEMVSSGVRELDVLTGGWPRGCLSEICGSASSGSASVLLATLAATTLRQEVCALVDASDMFDPVSAATAGVNFEKLLWVRCDSSPKILPRRYRQTNIKRSVGNSQMIEVEQVLRVTDLLLQSGGFGLVIIDLGGVSFRTARRIPLASWVRFQRAVEHTPTVLLVVTPAPCAQTCATVLLNLRMDFAVGPLASQLKAGYPSFAKKPSAFTNQQSANTENGADVPGEGPAHMQLLYGLSVEAELLRSRLTKPVHSVRTAFKTKTIRAG